MVCRSGHEDDPIEKMRHSCAHVMADAVVSLFPGTKVTIGPCIKDGFYYDFDSPHHFTDDDLLKIENKMSEIIKADLLIQRKELPKTEALEFFKSRGEKYKIEIIEGLADREPISLFSHGDFVDLCKGPHVVRTGEIRAFKLLHVAGSYWRGDEKRESLQRIYGTAWASADELKAHLERLEEAKRRDHRRLGKELALYTFHPEAPASPFFYPKGATVYRLIVDYIRGLYGSDYQEVITPQILDIDLWQRSGHLDHFKDNMYFTEVEQRQMAVKPMNCPGHCLMFSEKKWSYRELPVRFADFGRLHRFERSGVTHGLTRVRTFAQDDAHIFCTPEQMESEILNFIKLLQTIYDHFGFQDVQVALATRPESALGSPELWHSSEATLKQALERAGLTYQVNPGEGAFYGPKIEFQVKDALERAWQLGTLQVDYSMPERFDLGYITPEGHAVRPVMLHRAVLGSIERFMGILIEHCAGHLPFWLAPVQIVMIPITDEQIPYAQDQAQDLRSKGYRVEVDDRNEKLGQKIRAAQLQKIPYMAVCGKKEMEAQTVSLRHRHDGDLGVMPSVDLIPFLQKRSHEK